jgi:cold shock CspA family protein
MPVPVRITFREMQPLPAVERAVTRRAARLAHLCPTLRGCRLVVEAPHRKRDGYRVVLELEVPGEPIVVGHEPSRTELADALADAFRAARRMLRDHGDRRRAASNGRVVALSRGHGFGYIASEDGRKLFFAGGSVRGGMVSLHPGTRVKFSEEEGEARLVVPAV